MCYEALHPIGNKPLGTTGGHFNATLKDFASILVTRPGGCSLMRGPFALTMNGALGKILHSWGSTLTWTVQRQHAAQILGGVDSFFASSSFLNSHGQGFIAEELMRPPSSDPLLQSRTTPLSVGHVRERSHLSRRDVLQGIPLVWLGRRGEEISFHSVEGVLGEEMMPG
jgi:hypothetical protein